VRADAARAGGTAVDVRLGSGLSVQQANADFRAAVAEIGMSVTVREPIASHTTFRIGGPADLYVAVSDRVQLERVTALAAEHGLATMVLGGGSNLLMSDAGVRGLVIANQTRVICEAKGGEAPAGKSAQVIADSGVALAGLARWAIRAGWAGLEWAVSIPGTVGGAVIGNAGAHGSEIAAHLAWVQVARPGYGARTLTVDELGFGYRTSILKRLLAENRQDSGANAAVAVLAAGFQLVRGNVEEMTARADAFLAQRRISQPVEPSAGSIFRNPPGDHAGRLVEAAGLKGQRIGGAQISPRHANFVVNTGNARATDVVGLIELMRMRVHERFGIELEPEIIFAGMWDRQPPYGQLPGGAAGSSIGRVGHA